MRRLRPGPPADVVERYRHLSRLVIAMKHDRAALSGGIGIFGGTFDPPHVGHVEIAREAVQHLGLEEIIWVPAALPPHKRRRTLFSPETRLALVQTLLSLNPRFAIADIELRRAGPSYTVDTLRAFRAVYPNRPLVLVVGEDQFLTFNTWREHRAIQALAPIVVARRGSARSSVKWPFSPAAVLRTDIDISSTMIRAKLARGEDVSNLVPQPVLDEIRARGLYAPVQVIPEQQSGARRTLQR